METNIANYDTAFANFQAASSAMSGDSKAILKFNKGEWYAGKDNEELPLGTQLAVDMMNVEQGWVRWADNKPAERRMVPVCSGLPIAARDDLGHTDRQMWETDNQGKARDPWQKTVELPVRELAGERREFTIAGSSAGFEGACKALFKAFGEQGRANHGKTPVIALGKSKYIHREHGIIPTPDLPVVGWKTTAELEGPTKPAKPSKF